MRCWLLHFGNSMSNICFYAGSFGQRHLDCDCSCRCTFSLAIWVVVSSPFVWASLGTLLSPSWFVPNLISLDCEMLGLILHTSVRFEKNKISYKLLSHKRNKLPSLVTSVKNVSVTSLVMFQITSNLFSRYTCQKWMVFPNIQLWYLASTLPRHQIGKDGWKNYLSRHNISAYFISLIAWKTENYMGKGSVQVLSVLALTQVKAYQNGVLPSPFWSPTCVWPNI